MGRKTFALIVVSILLVVLPACNGSADATPISVQVTLTEFGVESSLTDFQVGVPYHFEITNAGSIAHEFMIAPPAEPGTTDMEAIDASALVAIEEDELPVGTTQTVDYTFTDADAQLQLEFSCHIEGHYEAGMKLPITVQ